ILGIHRLTLLMPRLQIKPGYGLQRNKTILSHPGQSLGFSSAAHDERVVIIVEQDGRQTRYCLINGNGGQMTAGRRRNSFWCSAEELQHEGETLVSRLVKAIKRALSGRTCLPKLILPDFYEPPECLTKGGIDRLDMQH